MARQSLLEQLARSLAWAEERKDQQRKRAAQDAAKETRSMPRIPPPPRVPPAPRAILSPPPATREDHDRRGLELYTLQVLTVLQRAPREDNLVRLPAPLVDRICEQLDYLLRLRAA